LVRKADRSLNRVYDEALRPAHLATTQFALLRNIERQPELPSLSDLARIMRMDRTTLSRNLHPLERDGFIAITSGPNRRIKLVALTPVGRAKITEALPLWQNVQDSVANAFGTTNRIDIEMQLHTLLDSLDQLSIAES